MSYDPSIKDKDASGNASSSISTVGTIASTTGSFPIDVKTYGAKGDWQGKTVSNFNSSTMTVTSSTAIFTQSDVGKNIVIEGAAVYDPTTQPAPFGLRTTGPKDSSSGNVIFGNFFWSTIASVGSDGKTAIVNTNSSVFSNLQTVYSTGIQWGTDDTTAIQAALNDASNIAKTTQRNPDVYIPAGWYKFSQLVIPGTGGIKLHGAGWGFQGNHYSFASGGTSGTADKNATHLQQLEGSEKDAIIYQASGGFTGVSELSDFNLQGAYTAQSGSGINLSSIIKINSVNVSNNGNTIIFTTDINHSLTKNDVVQISGIVVGSSLANDYNGAFSVIDIPATVQFSVNSNTIQVNDVTGLFVNQLVTSSDVTIPSGTKITNINAGVNPPTITLSNSINVNAGAIINAASSYTTFAIANDMHVEDFSVSISSASGDGTTVTYIANNAFNIGQTINITGNSAASYNFTNAIVASATSTQFTVTNSAAEGTGTGGTALIGGADLLTAGSGTGSNWTRVGSTGNQYQHTTGYTDNLTFSGFTPTANSYYQIICTVNGNAGSINVSLGGKTVSTITSSETFGIKAINTNGLIVAPTNDFNGTVTLSVQLIDITSAKLGNLANAKAQDGTLLKRIQVAGFAEDGFKFPQGGLPLLVHGCRAIYNMGYGINFIGSYPATGGATVYPGVTVTTTDGSRFATLSSASSLNKYTTYQIYTNNNNIPQLNNQNEPITFTTGSLVSDTTSPLYDTNFVTGGYRITLSNAANIKGGSNAPNFLVMNGGGLQGVSFSDFSGDGNSKGLIRFKDAGMQSGFYDPSKDAREGKVGSITINNVKSEANKWNSQRSITANSATITTVTGSLTNNLNRADSLSYNGSLTVTINSNIGSLQSTGVIRTDVLGNQAGNEYIKYFFKDTTSNQATFYTSFGTSQTKGNGKTVTVASSPSNGSLTVTLSNATGDNFNVGMVGAKLIIGSSTYLITKYINSTTIQIYPYDIYTGTVATGSNVSFKIDGRGYANTASWYLKAGGSVSIAQYYNPGWVSRKNESTKPLRLLDQPEGWQKSCIILENCGGSFVINGITHIAAGGDPSSVFNNWGTGPAILIQNQTNPRMAPTVQFNSIVNNSQNNSTFWRYDGGYSPISPMNSHHSVTLRDFIRTAILTTGISSSDTSITLNSAAESFPSQGLMLVDNECVRYFSKTANDNGTYTFNTTLSIVTPGTVNISDMGTVTVNNADTPFPRSVIGANLVVAGNSYKIVNWINENTLIVYNPDGTAISNASYTIDGRGSESVDAQTALIFGQNNTGAVSHSANIEVIAASDVPPSIMSGTYDGGIRKYDSLTSTPSPGSVSVRGSFTRGDFGNKGTRKIFTDGTVNGYTEINNATASPGDQIAGSNPSRSWIETDGRTNSRIWAWALSNGKMELLAANDKADQTLGTKDFIPINYNTGTVYSRSGSPSTIGVITPLSTAQSGFSNAIINGKITIGANTYNILSYTASSSIKTGTITGTNNTSTINISSGIPSSWIVGSNINVSGVTNFPSQPVFITNVDPNGTSITISKTITGGDINTTLSSSAYVYISPYITVTGPVADSTTNSSYTLQKTSNTRSTNSIISASRDTLSVSTIIIGGSETGAKLGFFGSAGSSKPTVSTTTTLVNGLSNLGLINVSSFSDASTGTITLSNVDKIAVLGDSYSESTYTLQDKSWISKLSALSDFNFENFAQAADTYAGNLDRIRKGTPKYHTSLSYKDYKPTYTMFISRTNDKAYRTDDQYLNDLRATIETTSLLGSKPIICSQHVAYYNLYVGRNYGIESSLMQIAKEYDGYFFNLLPYAFRTLAGTDSDNTFWTYDPAKWSGGHPGTRTSNLYSDFFEEQTRSLPKPTSSIKIFRKKTTTSVSGVDDLLFYTNKERLQKFKEISVGHSALNTGNYDDLTQPFTTQTITSEYLKLQNKESVSFTDYGLIEVTLPAISNKLSSVTLNLTGSSLPSSIYVKDVLKTPYTSPNNRTSIGSPGYQKFPLSDTSNIVVGDTFTTNDAKLSGTFTVREIDANVAIYCTSYTTYAQSDYEQYSIAGNNGGITLIRTAGSGTWTTKTTTNGTVGSYSKDYPNSKQSIGHWTQVTGTGGATQCSYTLDASIISKCCDKDKISFLIAPGSSFNLNDVSINYIASELKGSVPNARNDNNLKLGSNLISDGGIISGTAGAIPTNNWGSDSTATVLNPATYSVSYNDIPFGCDKIVKFNGSTYLTKTVNVANTEQKEYLVTVLARNNTASTLTSESYDYKDVTLEIAYGTTANSTAVQSHSANDSFYTSKMVDKVGTHWKECNFKIVINQNVKTFKFKISAENEVEMARLYVREIGADSSGVIKNVTTTSSSTYTILPNDYIINASRTSAQTIYLPTYFAAGTTYQIKRTGSNVTIDAGSGKTIDASQTYLLTQQYQSVTLVAATNNSWMVL